MTMFEKQTQRYFTELPDIKYIHGNRIEESP
jgi:hypothetical protein